MTSDLETYDLVVVGGGISGLFAVYGLAYGVKVPIVYTNVLISNWQAFKKLGICKADCPGSHFSVV